MTTTQKRTVMKLFNIPRCDWAGGITGWITYQGEDHEEIATYYAARRCKPGDEFPVTLLPDGPVKRFVAAERVRDGTIVAIELGEKGS